MELFRITKYFTTFEGDYQGNNSVPIFDAQGNVLEMVTPRCFADSALEGTVKLLDGRLLNVDGHYIACPQKVSADLIDIANRYFRGRYNYVGLNQDGSKYLTFKLSGAAWGIGVKGAELWPFACCAANLNIFPFGSALHVQELENIELPNGETNQQGLIRVSDTGGAFHTNELHIDLYTGTKQWADQLKIPDYCHVEVWKG